MAFNFDQKIREIKRLKLSLPIQVGNIAKNHYLKSFRDGGFTDSTFNPWEKRKTKNSSDRRNRANRAILVDSGALARSIRVGRATWNTIEVGSYGIPYASYHNKGEGNQPERKFVGPSKAMSREIRQKIKKEIKKTLK